MYVPHCPPPCALKVLHPSCKLVQNSRMYEVWGTFDDEQPLFCTVQWCACRGPQTCMMMAVFLEIHSCCKVWATMAKGHTISIRSEMIYPVRANDSVNPSLRSSVIQSGIDSRLATAVFYISLTFYTPPGAQKVNKAAGDAQCGHSHIALTDSHLIKGSRPGTDFSEFFISCPPTCWQDIGFGPAKN